MDKRQREKKGLDASPSNKTSELTSFINTVETKSLCFFIITTTLCEENCTETIQGLCVMSKTVAELAEPAGGSLCDALGALRVLLLLDASNGK